MINTSKHQHPARLLQAATVQLLLLANDPSFVSVFWVSAKMRIELATASGCG